MAKKSSIFCILILDHFINYLYKSSVVGYLDFLFSFFIFYLSFFLTDFFTDLCFFVWGFFVLTHILL